MTDLRVIPMPKKEKRATKEVTESILELLKFAEEGEVASFGAAWVSPDGTVYTLHYFDGATDYQAIGAMHLALRRMTAECDDE